MRFSSRARERHLPYIAIMRSDARAPAAAVLPTERWVQSLPSPAGVGYLHRHLKRTALITESSADVLSHGGAHALGLRDVFLANKAGTQLNSAEIGIEGWVGECPDFRRCFRVPEAGGFEQHAQSRLVAIKGDRSGRRLLGPNMPVNCGKNAEDKGPARTRVSRNGGVPRRMPHGF
jgi:hypothetical protein